MTVQPQPANVVAPSPKLAPGPRGTLRNLWEGLGAAKDVLGYTTRLARDYGDLVRIRIGPFQAFQVTNPSHAQQLLGRHSNSLSKPSRLQRVFRPWLGQGLLFSEGKRWLRQRKWMESCLKQLTPDSIVAPTIQCMSDETRRRVGETWDVVDLCERVAFMGLLRTLFGDVSQELSEQAYLDAMTLQSDGVRRMKGLVLPRWAPSPRNLRFRSALHRFRAFIDQQLQRCRRTPGDNLASHMIHAAAEHDISDEDLFSGATNMLFGGKAGVASLTWTAYALSRHPEIQQRVVDELDDITGGVPTVAHASSLPYLQATMKESFRLYPPVPMVTRQPREEIQLDEFRIPARSFVYIGIVLIHRDERWFPSPTEFRPERFLDGDGPPQGAYLPFGLGPHVCVGRGLASLQIPMAVAAMLSHCRLGWPEGAEPPKFEIDERLHPAGPLHLKVMPRDPAP